ncbi:phosphatase PAP2 family protein [Planococcus sp. CP5-4]|uniref:phosphatase PAP2 family protein n=1 Tax=unclassified Planococcus (in: firmicutes) TaxID=2662419 RepID=UPI001C224B51|nr:MULTISPECIES: phosphatase PAP2 family protein [unclassified Planococcus (in: firmicutes)]MBU9675059.1 phosphatase PAP2 family protein [Planococcus sp. CP5-4_YE]MBV0910409.1 phosphatase PAP2 family protein [Planococcus sp. CP5-4_UN]MBW6063815.1 phosphatase PAP2 family protein [Planococcus sp. CP5-4]
MDRETKLSGFAFIVLLVGLGLAALFITLFAELADEMLEQELAVFDAVVIQLLEIISSDWMDTAMFVITELGSVWFLVLMSLGVLWILGVKMRDKWGVLFYLVAVGGGSLLTLLLKHFFSRERPSINETIDAVGYSFPSGHSMGSLIFYGFLIYLVIRTKQNPRLQWVSVFGLSVLIMLIGISRIYLGAHFPSDVIAGYIAGTIWLVLSLVALEWIQWHQRSPVPPVTALRKVLAPVYRAVINKL